VAAAPAKAPRSSMNKARINAKTSMPSLLHGALTIRGNDIRRYRPRVPCG
jgi:hypothetical protein